MGESVVQGAERSARIETWDEYWTLMAETAARKSKDDPQVGAVVVRSNILLSSGFNGFPRNVFDDPTLLDKKKEKLRHICHAEENAILNAARVGVALDGAIIYVTKFPCLACCLGIIQAGIREIHTEDHEFWKNDPEDKDHTRKKSVLRQARIKVVAPFHFFYGRKPVTRAAIRKAAEAEATTNVEQLVIQAFDDGVTPIAGSAPKRTLRRRRRTPAGR